MLGGGQEIGVNKTKPITDEQYIEKILKIFGMDPYDGNLTGTTIIIPYIDEHMLLENNQIEYKDGEDNSIRPFWRCSIEDYLRVALQRWYAPRLNNTKYPYGKFLRAKINKKGIGLDNMEPTFQIVQALYNRAVSEEVRDDILNADGVECKAEEIVLRKVLETTKAGTVAYAKVPRKILKTGYPDNKPEPYMYFNCEIRDKENNKPVLFFTRKPGMIVSYEDVGSWVDGITASNKDEFIFAIFVLNSANKLTNTNGVYSLEEYVRKSEMADHTSWGDFSMGNNNPRIVSKVQAQVNSKISKEFSVEEEDTTSRLNSGLGKMFGDLLLPPENFGKKPSGGSGGGQGGNGHTETHKNIIFGYDPSKTKYFPNGMVVKLTIKSRGKISSAGINLVIDSETGAIKPEDWEEKMGLSMPFAIDSTEIAITKLDGLDSDLKVNVDINNVKNKVEDIFCELIKTNNNSGCGLRIVSDQKHQMEIELAVSLQLNRKDIKPLFTVEKNEGDK